MGLRDLVEFAFSFNLLLNGFQIIFDFHKELFFGLDLVFSLIKVSPQLLAHVVIQLHYLGLHGWVLHG